MSTIRSLKPWVDLTRVDKFAGTMVVFWPFAWGLTMAARTVDLPFQSFALTMLLGFFGACTGCVWNDILDRKIDAKVERTKRRPVASGAISVRGASIFLAFHIAILFMLMWRVNALAWAIGLITIFPLAGLYPLMKRITYWPQAWLGLAINTGIFMGWACVTGTCPLSSWVLTAGTWCWTIWYDTIYACQDKHDDVKAGVKSTALLFGSKVKAHLALFGCILTAALTISGLLNGHSLPYYLVSVLGGAIHLLSQWAAVDVESPASCWKTFHVNGFYFGAVVEAGMLLDYVLV